MKESIIPIRVNASLFKTDLINVVFYKDEDMLRAVRALIDPQGPYVK